MSRQKTLLGGALPAKEEKKAFNRMAERLAFCFSAPVVAHPSWSSIITPEQKAKAQMYRLAKVKNGEDDGQATDFEALLWISTASLDSPLDRHAFNIYAYLFRKLYPDQANEIFSDHEGRTLDKHMEEPRLRELKQKIYNSQVQALKERRKVREEAKKPKTLLSSRGTAS